MATRALVIALVSALLLPALPAQAAPLYLPPGPCADYGSNGRLHHTLSQWTVQAVQAGQFRAWRSGSTLVVAFQVAACGGAWMFAKFRSGQFTTNFFPDRGLGYVIDQVRGWLPVAKRAIIQAVAMAANVSQIAGMLITPIILPDPSRLPGGNPVIQN